MSNSTPEKRAARRALQHAVDEGRIVRSAACRECGRAARVEGHHHLGYDREHWLDVVWLCRRCHCRQHREPRPLPRSEPVAPKRIRVLVTRSQKRTRQTAYMRGWRRSKANELLEHRREVDRKYRDHRRNDPEWRARRSANQREYVARKKITHTESPA